MKKKTEIIERTVTDNGNFLILVLKDFVGMLNNKKFNLKANQSIEVTKAQYEWLRSKGIVE